MYMLLAEGRNVDIMLFTQRKYLLTWDSGVAPKSANRWSFVFFIHFYLL